jgi:hypothetical protein
MDDSKIKKINETKKIQEQKEAMIAASIVAAARFRVQNVSIILKCGNILNRISNM